MSRTILVGDVHACWDELQELLDRVALTPDDRLVSVGDVVDRGPDPASVVSFFRSRPNTVVVCGNHERKHVRAIFSRSQEITRAQLGPRYADDVAWMATLPYSWEDEQVRVVHASLIPGVPLAETPEDILCGTTSGTRRLEEQLGGQRWHDLYADERPVVFGHHVVAEPLVREGRVYGIDTGCCHGIALTALVLPSFELVSVPAQADHWRAVGKARERPVLASHRWAEMSFEQVARKVRELSATATPAGKAWLAEVEAGSAAAREAIPSLAEALDAQIALLLADGEAAFTERAAAHPASDLLFRRRAGRLSDGHLGCAGPGQVRALADRLGIPLPPAVEELR